MREQLIKACRTLVEAQEFNDFWALSLVRDNSFEEGDRSLPQKRLIARYERAGIPDYLLDQVRLGINGNLSSILRIQSPELGLIARNQGKGSDLIIGNPGLKGCGLVESKVVYECTLSKYYPEIARDYSGKLAGVRTTNPDAWLFLAVFFVECPSLNYPAGRWIDSTKSAAARPKYLTNRGIESQLGMVKTANGRGPTWPADAPCASKRYPPLEAAIRQSMVSLHENQFTPPWSFDPAKQLSGARVGVALWEYPK